ncbi:hypothetical protein EV363DRAFT_1186631 [Boletus edulis]|nr:hypothetical protein EV363DRAFT_1186631 [Boletus edulis]
MPLGILRYTPSAFSSIQHLLADICSSLMKTPLITSGISTASMSSTPYFISNFSLKPPNLQHFTSYGKHHLRTILVNPRWILDAYCHWNR